MKVETFIKRPVLSTVISILIVLIGIISLITLPVEQYPNIAPPQVVVSATYTGASASTVQKSVIVPIEEAINGVENMDYMTSTATNSGSASITVYFKQGTDPDMAAVNVQNRVATAQGLLPAEVTKIGVTTFKRQNSMLEIFALYSPDNTYDATFISNYMKINLQTQVARIPGVGEAYTLGNDYAMRIWLNPEVMAQYNLVPSDITAILGEQNIEASTGALGENSENIFQYNLNYTGRLEDVEQFENMVITSTEGGEVLRLKDVAEIELGAVSYQIASEVNGHPGSQCIVFQTAGSNATEVVNNINAFLDEQKENLPKGLEVEVLQNVNDFLYASISEVIKTLIEAIILVTLVVYFFLQDYKATLIPTISLVVSLVGTFIAISLAGFSINLLTLFALILAIGVVVDDAIVVVEAVQTKLEEGYQSSYLATRDAMNDVTNAIITCSLVFMAVFVPVCFTGGTAGIFYTQFGITLAVAVGISAINALTLSPALCAILMKPANAEEAKKKSFSNRIRIAYNVAFSTTLDKYLKGVMFFLHRKWLVWSSIAISLVALVVLMKTTKTGLVPNEDVGTIFVNVNAVPGSTLHETKKILDELEDPIKNSPEVQSYSKAVGYSLIGGQSTSFGTYIVKLKPWDEREGNEHSQSALVARLNAQFSQYTDAQVMVFAPGMIPGYGTGNSIDLHLQDRTGGDMNTFYAQTMKYLGALNARPEIQVAYTTFSMNYPQYKVDVDAAQCKRAGISPSTVLTELGTYCGGSYVSNINKYSKVYRVMLQADPKYRLDETALSNIYVRNSNGEMAPVSQFVKLERVLGAQVLNRFNLFPSIPTSIMTADGYSSGQAIKAIEEVSKEMLPTGYTYELSGISREEASGSGAGLGIVLTLCVVFIYLLLSALYESYWVPFAVILSVPFGLAGSFLFAKVMGLENNIYLQTGMIMLIGLLAKTAILLTEFATARRHRGMSLSLAAYSAAKVRLRPILMTAFTMIFGMLPMMFSTGVGANGNSSLGTGVVGGMIIGTLALLFIVPALFIAFEYIQEKFKPLDFSKHEDLLEQ